MTGSHFVTSVMHYGLDRSYFVMFAGFQPNFSLNWRLFFDFGDSLEAFKRSFWRLWRFFEDKLIARVTVWSTMKDNFLKTMISL